MTGIELAVGLILLARMIGKSADNQNPEKPEREERQRNAAKAKHQGWQTLDFTEPWSGHMPWSWGRDD